jgi:hypothetical protein
VGSLEGGGALYACEHSIPAQLEKISSGAARLGVGAHDRYFSIFIARLTSFMATTVGSIVRAACIGRLKDGGVSLRQLVVELAQGRIAAKCALVRASRGPTVKTWGNGRLVEHRMKQAQEGRFGEILMKADWYGGADGKEHRHGKHSDGLCGRIGRLRTFPRFIASVTAWGLGRSF